MRLTVKTLDLDAAGKTIAILNNKDAADLGVHPLDRVRIRASGKTITAIANTSDKFVKQGEILVYEEVKEILCLKKGQEVEVWKREELRSKEFIRNKVNGAELRPLEIREIVKDVVQRNLNDLELASFITALHLHGLSTDEAVALTKAMVETGRRINLGKKIIADKHSIGGVPGDKTTLILVPLIASAGLTIPKTSSRSITSPAGTADRAEMLMPVELDVKEIKHVVRKTNACVVWGGALDLSPADDLFIQIEHPLKLDPLLLPSILSKKKSVGATHVVIDIPTGRGAKIKTFGQAQRLADDFIHLGKKIGMRVQCGMTFGEQPIGYCMGPALEAREALQTITGMGPADLIDKATSLAGVLLSMTGRVKTFEAGKEYALKILRTDKIEAKFRQIIEAQGGDPKIKPEDIEIGKKTFVAKSKNDGVVRWINNAELVELAMAAGCPKDRGAGVQLYIKLGDQARTGEPLFTIYAEKKHKLKQAEKMLRTMNPVGVIDRWEKHMLTRNISRVSQFSLRT